MNRVQGTLPELMKVSKKKNVHELIQPESSS